MRLIACWCFTLFLTMLAFGQDGVENASPDLRQTVLIDKFGDLQKEEFEPRFQRFSEILKNNEGSRGYVFYFGSFSEPLFRQTFYYNRRRPTQFETYFIKYGQGLPIEMHNGGLREQRTIEFWFVPANGPVPKPAGEKELQRELLYRFELLETQDLDFVWVSNNSPAGDQKTATLELANRADLLDLLRVAGVVLNRDDSRRQVLIYYLNDEAPGVGEEKDVFERFVAENAGRKRLDLRRVKLVFGGFRRNSEVECWSIPVSEADPESMPDEKLEEIEGN